MRIESVTGAASCVLGPVACGETKAEDFTTYRTLGTVALGATWIGSIKRPISAAAEKAEANRQKLNKVRIGYLFN